MAYQAAQSNGHAHSHAHGHHGHSQQHHQRVPHYAAVTESREHHLEGYGSVGAQAMPQHLSSSPTAALHARPFVPNAAGSRNKNYKGTFGRFPHMPEGVDGYLAAQQRAGRSGALGQTQPLRSPLRAVDLRGAPGDLHRGVTSLRARSFLAGSTGSGIPHANATMSYSKEHEWEPNPYVQAQLKVGDNFRQRGEGLQGAKRKAAKIAALHGANGGGSFKHGAHAYHGVFDPTVRGLSANGSASPASRARGGFANQESDVTQLLRVPHVRPFMSSGAPRGVGADRSYLSGHAQFAYHYSNYGLSEKSLAETNDKAYGGTGPGFRAQCVHAVHFPMKSPTSNPSRVGGQTDRHPNFHAVQQEDFGCRHECNKHTTAAALSATARF